jgi:hypothetical protein
MRYRDDRAVQADSGPPRLLSRLLFENARINGPRPRASSLDGVQSAFLCLHNGAITLNQTLLAAFSVEYRSVAIVMDSTQPGSLLNRAVN